MNIIINMEDSIEKFVLRDRVYIKHFFLANNPTTPEVVSCLGSLSHMQTVNDEKLVKGPRLEMRLQ